MFTNLLAKQPPLELSSCLIPIVCLYLGTGFYKEVSPTSVLTNVFSSVSSLDGCSGPREDGSVRLPVGGGSGGAAGQPAGGVSAVLCRQTGTLAGESCLFHPSVSTVTTAFFFLFCFAALRASESV